jgi:hypothetical protein
MLVDMAPEKSSVYNLALFRYSSEDKRDLYWLNLLNNFTVHDYIKQITVTKASVLSHVTK